MNRAEEKEVTIYREVWELDDPLEHRGIEFETWTRQWAEESGEVEWVPHVDGEHMSEKFHVFVDLEEQDAFDLEQRRDLALYGMEHAPEFETEREEKDSLGETDETTNECQYTIPWAGDCGSDTVPGSDYCEKHDGETCFKCDKQAVKGCSHASSLVCGAPECEDHSHMKHHY